MRLALLALIVCVPSVIVPATAHAYPQWQFQSGVSRCDECHFAPSGGGLINSFGRDFVGDDLSTFGGNGAFAHGAVRLPSWLALGADLRGAMVAEDVQDPSGPSFAVFPMQADAEAHLSYGPLSFYGVAGLRGQIRSGPDLVPTENYQPIDWSQFISREHWLMLRAGSLGGYVQVGRFFAPFGLRMAEHILYVRQDLGFDTLQESYNLTTGYIAEQWEIHATAFAPDFVRHIGSTEGGFTVYGERRFEDVAAVGLQARVAISSGLTRTIAGATGKYWLPQLNTLLLGEADFVRRDIDLVPPSYQFVGMGGFSIFPLHGVLATFLAERNQVDLSVRGAAYDALDAFASWFPYAHIEVQVLGRLQFPSGTDAAKTFFVQLHYFL